LIMPPSEAVVLVSGFAIAIRCRVGRAVLKVTVHLEI
jgi:hypothetical protein